MSEAKTFRYYRIIELIPKNYEQRGITRKRLGAIFYDLEMKKRQQIRNNNRTKIERFDWFIKRIQTRVAFGWLSGRLISCPITF